MSIPVDIAALAEAVESFGPVAYLVTTGEGGAPHVVSVAPEWDGDDLVAPAGSSTSRNAQARPSVTLLWPGPPGGDYALIVDGAASVRDGAIAVRPTRAVQHRLATADQALPNCVAIESATATGLTGAGG